MSGRIVWRRTTHSERGSVSGMQLFGIHYGVRRQDAMWSLSTTLPAPKRLVGQHYATPDDAKVAAEEWLTDFIARLSAPPTETTAALNAEDER